MKEGTHIPNIHASGLGARLHQSADNVPDSALGRGDAEPGSVQSARGQGGGSGSQCLGAGAAETAVRVLGPRVPPQGSWVG